MGLISWLFRPREIFIKTCNELLPRQIADETEALVSELCIKGWRISSSVYDHKHFGNWYIDLHRDDEAIRLVKDRSQYQMYGPSLKELEEASLNIPFNSFDTFQRTVSIWASKHSSLQ
jgi:hypothetical protein